MKFSPRLTELLIRYEEGDLEEDEVVKLFQHLVDTGLAWELQGSYGRMAHRLIEDGLVVNKNPKPEIKPRHSTPQHRRKKAS